MTKILPIVMTLLAAFSAGGRPTAAADVPDAPAPTEQREFVKPPRAEKGGALFIIVGDGDESENAELSDGNGTQAQAPDQSPAPDQAQAPDRSGAAESKDGISTPSLRPGESAAISADELFELKKAALDRKYERMFEIKARIDGLNAESDRLWSEYDALRRSYEREYKRAVGEWASDSLIGR